MRSNNLFCCCFHVAHRVVRAIESMLQKDIADNKAIGDFGAEDIIKNRINNAPVRILTHCNTGSLATAGYGTALGVVRSLFAKKVLGELLPAVVHL